MLFFQAPWKPHFCLQVINVSCSPTSANQNHPKIPDFQMFPSHRALKRLNSPVWQNDARRYKASRIPKKTARSNSAQSVLHSCKARKAARSASSHSSSSERFFNLNQPRLTCCVDTMKDDERLKDSPHTKLNYEDLLVLQVSWEAVPTCTKTRGPPSIDGGSNTQTHHRHPATGCAMFA